MQNISSQLTLVLKLVFPVTWVVFWGTVILYLLTTDEGTIFSKTIICSLFFLGALLYYFLHYPLKRVEMDDEFMYVGNYREMRRYSLDSIKKITKKRILFIPRAVIHLHEAGNFGDKIVFRPGNQFDGYMEKHPEVKEKIED